MPLDVGDVVQHTYRSLWEGQRVLLVTNWLVQSSGSGGSEFDDLAAIAAFFLDSTPGLPFAEYQALLPSSVVVRESRAQRIYPTRTAFYSDTANIPGGDANDPTTGNVTAGVIRRTPMSGDNQKGTLKIGPVPSNAVVGGLIATGYRTKLTTFATVFTSSVLTPAPESIGMFPVLFHRGTIPPSSTILTNFLLGDAARVLGRRTVGRGE